MDLRRKWLTGGFRSKAAALLFIFLMAIAVFGPEKALAKSKGTIILFTNDVHCSYDADENTIGVAELAAYRARLEDKGFKTLLADAGDFIQGQAIGTVSKGDYPGEIMADLGYNVAIPGNHEFDYTSDVLISLAERGKENGIHYICSNFVDIRNGNAVLDDSVIIKSGKKKIGFVGIATPETASASNPKFFKDKDGNLIYDFCNDGTGYELYKRVQESVDKLKAEGADVVIALGHTGFESDKLTFGGSKDIIENTTGIDLYVDGHSHKVYKQTVKNADGEEVTVVQTGTQLMNIGKIKVKKNGSLKVSLVPAAKVKVNADPDSAENIAYEDMTSKLQIIKDSYSEYIGTKFATSKVVLTSLDNDDPDYWIVRKMETNAGDFVTDAYRYALGTETAFINGGGVRANIGKGDITLGDLLAINPYDNTLCTISLTGQQLLDALEWGAHLYPATSGSFPQVSGISFELHAGIPSSITVDEAGNFLKVDGEYRVKNVKVNGEPLDLEKKYTMTSISYLVKSYGSGFSMFKGAEILQNETVVDNQALITYLQEGLNGKLGKDYADSANRIVIIK